MSSVPRPPLTASLLLGCFVRLVPARERWEWRQQWRSELWYVVRESEATGGVRAWWTATYFALGALQDAMWMRQNAESPTALLQSPRQCALWLVGLAAFSLTAAWLLPGAREAMTSLNQPDARPLASISRAGLISGTAPTIDLAEYQRWQRRSREWFSDVAFYRIDRLPIETAGHKVGNPRVAVASENLAHLLGLETGNPAAAHEARANGHAVAIMTADAARKLLGAGEQTGRLLSVAGQSAVVAVTPAKLERILPEVDVVLLLSDAQLSQMERDTPGYAIAELTAAGQQQGHGRRWSFTTSEAGENIPFVCTPIADRTPRPISTLLFALFLACLALPATTPLPLGEYPAAHHPRFSEIRWRRWAFLAMKLTCLIGIVACTSLAVSFGPANVPVDQAACIELFTSFTGLLFAFRWALRDQRLRCPVCLGLLSNPARVGHPSRSFLAWHGTELICGKGHGLLHVPEMATSWFSTQRWLALDGSWRALFPNLAQR